MSRWIIVLIVAGVLTGAKMLAHPAIASDPGSRAVAMAAAIQSIAPKAVDDMATIISAKADGTTVVVMVRLDRNLPGALSSGDRETIFTTLTCRQRPNATFIQSGGAIRYELMRGDGSLYDSVTVDHCAAGA